MHSFSFVCVLKSKCSHESVSNVQAALETLRAEMTAKEKCMEKEMEALRKAGREREKDLDMLNMVLQCNQDIINVRADKRVKNGIKLLCILH